MDHESTIRPANGLRIRNMKKDDLPSCQRLVELANWNQTEEDWIRAMELEPLGCFVGEIEGDLVATTTVCCFDKVAWIAMVLVDIKVRRQGIAKKMLEHALKYCETKEITSICLDATDLGRGLYENLGFKEVYEVIRFEGQPKMDFHNPKEKLFQLTDDEDCIQRVLVLDRELTGITRERLLRHLFKPSENKGISFYGRFINKELKGYVGARHGRTRMQIGPLIASTPDTAYSLINGLFSENTCLHIYWDVLANNNLAIQYARSLGLYEQRRFFRMCKGQRIEEKPASIWASFGPEKG